MMSCKCLPRTLHNLQLRPSHLHAVNSRLYLSSENVSEKSKAKIPRATRKLYASAWQFPRSEDLLTYMASNVLHIDKAGVVIINKPYGLPIEPSKDSNFSLRGTLKDLAGIVGVDKLELIKSTPRYTSGCVILSSNNRATKMLERSINRLHQSKYYYKNFLAVSVGHPRSDSFSETVDVLSTVIPDKEDIHGRPIKEAVITKELRSHTQIKKTKGDSSFRVALNMDVISRSGKGKASLVYIQATSIHRHLLLAYMSDKLSPILGDRFYSYRVRNLMGVPTKVLHEHSPGAPMPQQLPEWMLELLGLRKGDEDVIPLHFHNFKVHLPHLFGMEKHLTVYAPPPTYFQSTLAALDLKFDQELFKSEDENLQWKLARPRMRQTKNRPDVEVLPPEEIAQPPTNAALNPGQQGF